MDLSILINQKVLHKDGTELIVAKVIESKRLDEVSIVFEGGKTFRLMTCVEKGIITFKDPKIQQQVLDAIDEHNGVKAQIKIQNEENEKIAREVNRKKAEEEAKKNPPLHKRRTGNEYIRKDNQNVAYKATYCDGNGNWFTKPCSLECRERNCSKNARAEFCKTNSLCKRYIDGQATEQDIQNNYSTGFLCYECRLLVDYKVYAGLDYTGKPFNWRLNDNRLVVLTTIKPGCAEVDRVIFGIMLVDKSYPKDGDKEAYATTYPDCRLSLTEEEAEEMKYWDYSKGDKGNRPIQWTERLWRCQPDSVCARILKDMVDVIAKRNNKEQLDYAQKFLNKFLEMIKMDEDEIPEKDGARLHIK